jgi:hypothetical protein
MRLHGNLERKSLGIRELLQWSNLIGSLQKKKVETMEAPQIEDMMERWSASPFGPPT